MGQSNETYSTLAKHSRNGISFIANFDFFPKWTGGRFAVYKGIMFATTYAGDIPEKCVVKTPRCLCHSTTMAETCISYLVKASAISREFAKNFRSPLRITFVPCFTTTMEEVSRLTAFSSAYGQKKRRLREDDPVLFEKYIKCDKKNDFKTYIERDGTITCHCCPDIEALVHMSYIQSNEQFLITGLKGVLKDGKCALTTPSIQSFKCEYGPDDQGPPAILKFFNNHKCNSICRDFPKPNFTPNTYSTQSQLKQTNSAGDLDTNYPETKLKGKLDDDLLSRQPCGLYSSPPDYLSIVGTFRHQSESDVCIEGELPPSYDDVINMTPLKTPTAPLLVTISAYT